MIVLDVWLPDGTSFDLFRWIAGHKRFEHIPVIMFTASKDPEHAPLAGELGVCRYLQKPTHYGNLVSAIKEELQAARAFKASGSRRSSVAR